MSVGGHVRQITRVVIDNRDLLRIEVRDKRDSTVVYAEPTLRELEPEIGQVIWWQGDFIYYDGDRRTLVKVGNSSGRRY